jgi:hypothetical protein
MTLSIKGLYVTLIISDAQHKMLCHYAECRILFIVIIRMSVIMLNVVMLNAVLLSVVTPNLRLFHCRMLALFCL